MDVDIHDHPSYHKHAEATTSELFYDLFFVANLTTFTSMLEINDRTSLTAYIGFFSLLWLTWYQVSLYDVRFSTDSVFERIAKAIHFGVMVGFAVMGVQWKAGQEVTDFKIFKAFGLILMVSRFTLACQYGITLIYSRKYKKTVVPIAAIIASTTIAGVLYGALVAALPAMKYDADGSPIEQKSDVYIAWYIIGIVETLITVSVSCIWRVISFKGTHMVQRMSLLTLIILGEGIIVICKSLSKIVKNEFLWTAAVVGQIIAAILIIYFLYMLYFDRLQEEHFGTIKQQWWSFLHFPLHTSLVLVLQGVSLLVIWIQAVKAFDDFAVVLNPVLNATANLEYASGIDMAAAYNATMWASVYDYVPKGVDASKAIKGNDEAMYILIDAYDSLLADPTNETAVNLVTYGTDEAFALASKTIFDSLSVSIPKNKEKKDDKKGDEVKRTDPIALLLSYIHVFELVFTYVFVAGGLSLILTTLLGGLSLPARQRKPSQYIRLGINGSCGLGLCLISLIKFNKDHEANYLVSVWMIPTLCIVYFVCVLANHVRLPGKAKSH
ncbi:uncharacterized protein EI97DRAFT_422655 [Westerdykella ornata]|uniref:Low temperature requirement A n=1 Tax=Westerdykella ornata TaxID=318751 RepID=A0A6A6JCA7_WESOR|nr:uncharacterized protein EI97DRAFT_422655 [Westerdykella ornata]KAF2274201.1 hypothetical protein EI97DRAFT_422655 [Westerdykella ornata]